MGSTVKHFGTTADGADVQAITLSGHGMSVTVLTMGAILQDVRLDGVDYGLTVGSDTLADYEGSLEYFGGVVAPVANRISGAAAPIDGKTYRFEANLNATHTLHGGSAGTHKAVWDIDEVSKKAIILSLFMPNGHGGFPGNRTIKARFDILSGPILRLTLTTITDATTILNATNHSYWNLDGTDTFDGHTLQIAASRYLPCDADALVTGDICDVASTAFDFRDATPVRPNIPPLDNTFCVADDRRALTQCAWVTGASGVQVTIATTEPGVHIYDARHAGYTGFAVEAQMWPDAPNRPNFPSIAITPEAPAVQITQWQFSKP